MSFIKNYSVDKTNFLTRIKTIVFYDDYTDLIKALKGVFKLKNES